MPVPAKSREEKFEMYAQIGDKDQCWNWTGYINDNGYGLMRGTGWNYRAHRWAYEHFIGPIPEGKVLDHLCRNRRCVNPHHLEPVTLVENLNRGIRTNANRGITHCLNGHEFTEENTRIDKRGKRACRTCVYLRGRSDYLRRKFRLTISSADHASI